MSVLSRTLRENLTLGLAERIWEGNKGKIRESRDQLLDRGYDSCKVDRMILREFTQFLRGLGPTALRGFGVGTAEYGDLGADSTTGGKSAARTYIEQKAIGMVVKSVNLDPEKGFGLTLANALETVLEDITDDDFTDMISSADGCHEVSYKIAVKALKIIEESESERLLRFAMLSLTQELGQDFIDGKFTNPIYVNIKEKFSKALSDIIDEEALAKSLSSELCGKFNLDNLLGGLGDTVGDAAGTMFSSFSGALQDIGDSIGDISFDTSPSIAGSN